MPREALWLAPRDRLKVYASLGALAGVLVIVVSTISVFVAFATPNVDPRTYIGRVSDFEVGLPVTLERGKFFVVRQPDGRVLAFSPGVPHPSGCGVEWMPDFVFGNGDNDRAGWLRDPCTRSTWQLDGTRAFGPALDLSQYPVEIRGERVYVWARPGDLIRGKPPRY